METHKIISVQFPKDSIYDNAHKRLRFIRTKLNVEPMKKQHTTKNYHKYRISEKNPKKRHRTHKIDGANIILEY